MQDFKKYGQQFQTHSFTNSTQIVNHQKLHQKLHQMENGMYVMVKTRQKYYFDTNRLQLLSRAELFWFTHSPEPQECALFWIFGLKFEDIFFLHRT